ncbi:MAG: hypothetical protein J6386_06080 [Candidatus Synoicihabitans palmerolidicus]|nr:hypothetical protein [Candidatus Synoicihabitans palmerolidicus]
MKLIHKAVGDEIALQSWLRPALTTVGPNKDYGQFREQLDAVDRVRRASHLESMAMDFARVGFESVDAGQLRRRLEFERKALRVNVLRMLLGNMPFRQLSRTIASSDLLADFCGVRTIAGHQGRFQERVGASFAVLYRRTGAVDGSGVYRDGRRGGPGGRTRSGRAAVDGDVPGGLDVLAHQHPLSGGLGAAARCEPNPAQGGDPDPPGRHACTHAGGAGGLRPTDEPAVH